MEDRREFQPLVDRLEGILSKFVDRMKTATGDKSAEESILRPSLMRTLFSVYGAGLRKQLLWDLSARLAAAPAAIELSGTGEELRDWTSIDDIVRVLPALAQIASPACPTMNVGTGRGVRVRDIAGLALAAWPSPARLSFNGAARPGDPFSLIADTTRLSALGIACAVQAEDGVARYIGWSRAQTGVDA